MTLGAAPGQPVTPTLPRAAGHTGARLLRAQAAAFATTRDEDSGARFRSYVLPVGEDAADGYVLTWASLEPLSTDFLRIMVAGVVVGGTLVAAAGSYAVADRALRPVAEMTRTARAIAVSRGFGRRLEGAAGGDDLGRLANTFNEMLDSLEEAYRLQQRFVADAAH